MVAWLRELWEWLVNHPWLVGDPALPGAQLGRRTRWLTIGAIVIANAVGAVVVVCFALFVLPKPAGVIDATVDVLNLAVALGYVVLALLVGVQWGRRRLEGGRNGIRGWLYAERAPSAQERAVVLRGPLRIMEIQAVLWGTAVLCFTALNATFSWLLALGVGLTVALGGLTTSAAAYLLGELALRPVVSRALATEAPERQGVPGVATRWLLAWALGTGVPIVGLLLVAIVALTPVPMSKGTFVVTTIVLCAIGLVFGALVSLLAAYATVHPIGAIRRALARVQAGDLGVELQVWDGTELGLLQAGFNDMASGLRERERIRDVFGRQVGEDVARHALAQEIRLGGEVRRVSVLFVDLVGSTALAAERPPQQVVELLNRFFAEVVDVVEESGGWINKFAGDAALAVFGAPLAIDDDAGRALRAARALHERLAERVPELDAGIGVASGPVVAGNLGAERRFEYTVIGDPVNEAARLTDLAKQEPGRVLAAAGVVEAAAPAEAARWRIGEAVQLRGRPAETRLARPAP